VDIKGEKPADRPYCNQRNSNCCLILKPPRRSASCPAITSGVGLVWIDLTAPSYGIHGTPAPEKIGKTESHGCIRLTNWDALDLAGMVHRGTVVDFVG
jgi:lipoprotein-anchoring transpeptidase ErfK/SrfK